MALKDTVSQMRSLLADLCHDLEKSSTGNKAAAQRVRTGSIKFAKLSKLYRKESVAAERGGKSIKKTKSKPKAAPKKAAKRATAKTPKRR